MNDNHEPAALGTIEEVPVAGLDSRHEGRQVSIPGETVTIHGVLGSVCRTRGSKLDVEVNGAIFRLDGDRMVRVVVQTAAEAFAEQSIA